MSWEVFRPSRATVVCLVLLLVAFLAMTFRLTNCIQAFRSFCVYWIYPSEQAVASTVGLSRGVGLRFVELIRAHHENILFKNKIIELTIMKDQYQESLVENQRLRRLLNLKFVLSFETIPAFISGRDFQNWMSAVFIDKGTEDGVTPDCPVIAVRSEVGEEFPTEAGVFGRVLESSARSSKVLLFTDPLSAIAVSLRRTGEQGLVTGRGGSPMVIEYLDPGADVQVGDEIVTSGLGGIFPAGLFVGKISDIVTLTTGFKKGEIETAILVNQIREVLVIKKK